MFRKLISRTLLVRIAVAVMVILAAGSAVTWGAVASAAGETISACYTSPQGDNGARDGGKKDDKEKQNDSQNGFLRIVKSTADCRKNETPLQWNTKGDKGDKGSPGVDGAKGLDGTNGTSVTVATEPVGANCAAGGAKLTGVAGSVAYVCNGAAAGSANSAPVAHAGNDVFTSTFVTSATLNGSATDDGLPGGPLSYSWSQVSGPSASIASPHSAITGVSLPTAGVYTFTLTVSDGALSATDEVVFSTVLINRAPQPFASLQGLSPGATTATLSLGGAPSINVSAVAFSGLEDGLPGYPSVVTSFTWSQVSGPAIAVMSIPNGQSTQITMNVAGVYTFKVTQFDGELYGDSMPIVITVTP